MTIHAPLMPVTVRYKGQSAAFLYRLAKAFLCFGALEMLACYMHFGTHGDVYASATREQPRNLLLEHTVYKRRFAGYAGSAGKRWWWH
jgi:hypothetical protein